MAKKATKKKQNNFKFSPIIPIFLFIVLFLVIVLTRSGVATEEHADAQDPYELIPSATVMIPDTGKEVSLTSGQAKFDVEGTEGTVSITKPYLIVGDDVFAVMTYNTGGSGEFVAIARFNASEGHLKYEEVYPIDDRIKVENISAGEPNEDGTYALKVDYLGRNEDQPMVDEPTVRMTTSFEIKAKPQETTSEH